MALKVGQLFASLALNTQQFNTNLAGAKAGLKNFALEIAGSMGIATTSWAAFSAAAVMAAGGVGLYSGKLAGDVEQVNMAFETLLGNAEAAKEMTASLRKMGAQTPFEFQDLTKATQTLLAFGFTAEEIIPTLTSVGDAVSGLNMGAAGMDQVARVLGQIKAVGTLQGSDAIQLAHAGITAYQYVATK